jgi:hypothetical protein
MRVFQIHHLQHLDKLRHSPIIDQEKIEKGLDIRVNIFGDKIFAASVNTFIPTAEIDWRIDLTSIWKEHTLSDAVGHQLVRLLRNLGLH